jgi:hypothetical protein
LIIFYRLGIQMVGGHTHTARERERERWKGAVMMCTPPVATLPTNNGKWTLTC